MAEPKQDVTETTVTSNKGMLAKVGAIFATRTKRVVAIAGLVVALIAGVGGISVALSYRTVTLEVDGVSRPVSGFNSTVGDVLAAAGIKLGQHDVVAPTIDKSVRAGAKVVVRTGREVDIVVGQERRTAWTTALSATEALSDLEASGRGISLLASRSSQRKALPVLPEGGTVILKVDGADRKLSVHSGQDALAVAKAAGIELGGMDEVHVLPTTPELTVKVVRVHEGERTEEVAIAHESKQVKDDTLAKGKKKVTTEGKDGVLRRVVFERKVDGKVISSKVRSETRVSEPVTEVVNIGTKEEEAPKADQGSAPSGSVWASLAQCESGGNPAAVSGSGKYHGLYQFSVATWKAMGGTGLPSQASAEEQTKRAQMLQARSGWGQWPACARKLGLL